MSNLRELTDREVDIVSGGWMLSNNNIFINVGNTVGAQIGQQNNILLSWERRWRAARILVGTLKKFQRVLSAPKLRGVH